MSDPLIVKVPAKHRSLGGVPDRPMEIVSLWEMSEGRVGIWLREAGSPADQRWPVTGVTREQVLGWQIKDTTDE